MSMRALRELARDRPILLADLHAAENQYYIPDPRPAKGREDTFRFPV